MTKGMKGNSYHNLDSKGRLIIPARFRESLGASFVVCRGMDGNIFVYPNEEWEKFSEKLSSLPVTDKNSRKLQAFFLGSAYDCEVDGQFRVVIPQVLRDSAKIDKEIVMVGNGSKAQIWSKEAWEEYNSIENMDIDEIASTVGQNFLI